MIIFEFSPDLDSKIFEASKSIKSTYLLSLEFGSNRFLF